MFQYCGDKGHIRPLFHIKNVKVPNGLITWTPKSPSTNPTGCNVS